MGGLSGSKTISRLQISGWVDMVILHGIILGWERIHSSSGSRSLLGLVLVALGRLWYARGCGLVASVFWRAKDGKEWFQGWNLILARKNCNALFRIVSYFGVVIKDWVLADLGPLRNWNLDSFGGEWCNLYDLGVRFVFWIQWVFW